MIEALPPMPSGPLASGLQRWPTNQIVRLPCRLDLIGGWADQLCWDGPAAVVNFAAGWDGRYPLTLEPGGILRSEVEGQGTGLGISSILDAGRFLQRYPWAKGRYVQHVLDYEARIGTCGGWQDQIGGVEPGFKLIETDDHREFRISRRDDHPIIEHLVLFDTGVRRDSGRIGDKVRAYIKHSPRFREELELNVLAARVAFQPEVPDDTEADILICLEAWQRLCYWVPEIDLLDLPPFPDLAYGHKLCGAGGGGYGVYFAKEPGMRVPLIARLLEGGLWAVIPEVLPGLRYEGEQ